MMDLGFVGLESGDCSSFFLPLSLWKWFERKSCFLMSLNLQGYFQSNGNLFYLGSHWSPKSWIVHWNSWCSNIKPSWDPTQCQNTLQDWNPEAWGQATCNVPKNYWAKRNHANFCPLLPLGHVQQKPDIGTSSVLGMTRLSYPALSSSGSQSSTHVHSVPSGSDWACRLLRESCLFTVSQAHCQRKPGKAGLKIGWR